MSNSFEARSILSVNGKDHEIYRLDAVPGSERLPYSLKILLENLLRHEDGRTVTAEDISAMAAWDPEAKPSKEIAYTPAGIDAGFYRRACGGGSCRHARSDAEIGRRSGKNQPIAAGRTGY